MGYPKIERRYHQVVRLRPQQRRKATLPDRQDEKRLIIPVRRRKQILPQPHQDPQSDKTPKEPG